MDVTVKADVWDEFHDLTHRSVRWLFVLGLSTNCLFGVADSQVLPSTALPGMLTYRGAAEALMGCVLAFNLLTRAGDRTVASAYVGIVGYALCTVGLAVRLGTPSDRYPAFMLMIATLALVPWRAVHTWALGGALWALWMLVNFAGLPVSHLEAGPLLVHGAHLAGALALAGTVTVTRQRNIRVTIQKQTDFQDAIRQREKLARQTAHDIRSPVTALQVIQDQSALMDVEDRQLLREAIERVTDIANNLVSFQGGGSVVAGSSVTETPISPLLHAVLAEKRASFQASGIQFVMQETGPAAAAFARVNAPGFTRSVSNLLNNAAESMSFAGVVNVGLEARSDHLELSIRDSGCGIASEDLTKVLQGGVSIGKPKGQGLGLSSAASAMQQWGGSLRVDSIQGMGTTILIDLPTSEAPAWFAPAIQLAPGTVVLALDDDSAMARLWTARLSDAAGLHEASLLTFRRPEDFITAVEAHNGRRLCLVDAQLYGNTLAGVQAVEKAQCWSDVIFVTSRYNDPGLQKRCIDHGAHMAPKAYAAHIPIRMMR